MGIRKDNVFWKCERCAEIQIAHYDLEANGKFLCRCGGRMQRENSELNVWNEGDEDE